MGPYRIFIQRTSEDTARTVEETRWRSTAIMGAAGWFVAESADHPQCRVFVLDLDGRPIVEIR